MAFSARGMLNYMDWADKQRQLEEAKMDQREALAFELTAKYGMGNIGGLTGTKSGKSKAGATPMGIATKALQNTYNLDDTVLTPIIASGDKTAPGKLLGILEDQRLKYENQGLALPDEVVKSIVESAVVTQPTTRELDFTEIESYIGREMDSMLKSVLQAGQTTPGSVFIPEPAFVERPSLEDLDKFEKRAVQFNISRAEEELELLRKRQAALTSVSETTQLTTDQMAEAGWIATRIGEVQDAVKSLDNDNVSPIVGLYGSAYTSELTKYYPKFEDAPLNPALLKQAERIVSVPNRAVAEALANAGIFKQGDIVMNMETGKKIRIGG